jgi:hypothetical protein
MEKFQEEYVGFVKSPRALEARGDDFTQAARAHGQAMTRVMTAFFDDVAAAGLDYAEVLEEEFQYFVNRVQNASAPAPETAFRSKLSKEFLEGYDKDLYHSMLFCLQLIIQNGMDDEAKPMKDLAPYISEIGIIRLTNDSWVSMEYLAEALTCFYSPVGLTFIALLIHKLTLDQDYFYSTYQNAISEYLLYVGDKDAYDLIIAHQNVPIERLAEEFKWLKGQFETQLGFTQ